MKRIRLYGRNVFFEAVRAGGRIERVMCLKHLAGEISRVYSGPLEIFSKSELYSACGSDNHQGVVFDFLMKEEISIKEYLSSVDSRQQNDIVVILDGILDPRNLGAIARTSLFFGVKGLGLPRRRRTPVTASAVKTSAGALLKMDIIDLSNTARALDLFKEAGYWVVGTDVEKGEELKCSPSFKGGRLVVVIGSEGEGIGRLIRDKCDYLVTIKGNGDVESLNASVAAAIVLWTLTTA